MVNDNTREYSVYISDEASTVQGSGVLFYAGGDSMFVFTCAHVVENLDKIRLFILKEIDASRDLYNVLYTEVSAAQVIYSPLDEIQNNEFGEKLHTEDIAVIQIKKPETIELSTTQYYIMVFQVEKNRLSILIAFMEKLWSIQQIALDLLFAWMIILLMQAHEYVSWKAFLEHLFGMIMLM